MFGWDRQRLRQCLIVYRKHMGRHKHQPCHQIVRHFSSGKYTKLGNLYARLGIQPNATQTEIKEAYYQLSKEYHPDRNVGKADLTSKFRSITEAYEILGNESTRAEYDRGRRQFLFHSLICGFLNISQQTEFQKHLPLSITETPYSRITPRRSRFGQSPTSAEHYRSSFEYNDKDDDLVNKIRFYQEVMRKRARNPSDANTFRKEKPFNFDAWNDAHYNNRHGRHQADEKWTENSFRTFRSKDPFDMNGRVPPGYPQGNIHKLRPQRPSSWRPPLNVREHLDKEHEANMKESMSQFVRLMTIVIVGSMVIAMLTGGGTPPRRRPLPPLDERPRND